MICISDSQLVNTVQCSTLFPPPSKNVMRSLFLPEGVSPASGILQRIVSEIFSDFDDWTIVIFDNFLILANDLLDAKNRMEQFFDRCIEKNIFLKATKSYFGFTEVKFFLKYVWKIGRPMNTTIKILWYYYWGLACVHFNLLVLVLGLSS